MLDQTVRFFNSLRIDPAELLALEKLAERKEDLAVFVSGSLVEGLGNETSDIDLYVIGAVRPIGDRVISKKSFICISKHEIAGRRVDVEFWEPKPVNELAELLASVVVDRDLDAFECEELDFMHRVKHGLPLIGDANFARWQQRFDQKKLVRYTRYRAEVNVRDVLEDLEGMLADRDLEVAMLRCQDLLGDVCEFSLRSIGETNPKRKWSIKLLAKYPDIPFAREVRARFWSLQFPQNEALRTDPTAQEEYVRSCMLFAQDILDSAPDA